MNMFFFRKKGGLLHYLHKRFTSKLLLDTHHQKFSKTLIEMVFQTVSFQGLDFFPEIEGEIAIGDF